MRVTVGLGILLIILGCVVLITSRFGNQRDVLKVGDITVTANDRPSSPPWVSGLMIAAGVVLVVSASRRRRAA